MPTHHRITVLLCALFVGGCDLYEQAVAEYEAEKAAQSAPLEPASSTPPTPSGPTPQQVSIWRLGMTYDEARAAAPDPGRWRKLPPEYSRYHDWATGFDLIPDLEASMDYQRPLPPKHLRVPIPGRRYLVRSVVGDEPANCELQFAIEDRLGMIDCRLDTFPDRESHEAAFQRIYDELVAELGPYDSRNGGIHQWTRDGAFLRLNTLFQDPDPITRPDGRSWLGVMLLADDYSALREELRAQVERQREEHHERQTAAERERRAREVERLR